MCESALISPKTQQLLTALTDTVLVCQSVVVPLSWSHQHTAVCSWRMRISFGHCVANTSRILFNVSGTYSICYKRCSWFKSTLAFTNIGLTFFYRCTVYSEIHTVHSPTDAHLLKRTGHPGLWARTACSFRSAQAATLLEFMYHSRIVLSVGGSVWYMTRNLRCAVTIDSVLANSKTQNAFLFTVNAIFRHDYPLAVEPGSTPRTLVQKKLGEILYQLICSFPPCLSWLLRSRVRKSRRDL